MLAWRHKINFILFTIIIYILIINNLLYSQYSDKTISVENFLYISESSIDMYSDFNSLLKLVELSGTKNIYLSIDGLAPFSENKKYSIPVDYPINYNVVEAEISTFNMDLYLKYNFCNLQSMLFLICNSCNLNYYYNNRRYSDDSIEWSYTKYLTGFGLQYSEIHFYSSIIRTKMPIIAKNDNREYCFSRTSNGDTNDKSTTEGYYFLLNIYGFSNNIIIDPHFEKIKFLNFKKSQYSVNFIDDLILSINYINFNNSYQPGIEIFKKNILDLLNINFKVYLNLYENDDKKRRFDFGHSILELSTFRGYWKQNEFDRSSRSCSTMSQVFYFNLDLSYSRDLYDINLFGYCIAMGMYYSSELGTINFETGISRNYFENLINLPIVNENLIYLKANFIY